MRTLFLTITLSLSALPAGADGYRWTDPTSGKTVYSDTPPPKNIKNVSQTAADNSPAPLPLALQKAAAHFPVTLYTSAACGAACDEARALLKQRKIPFTEKPLKAEADYKALKALVGEPFVPTLQVGKETRKGFLAEDYHRALDVAGYPGRPAQP